MAIAVRVFVMGGGAVWTPFLADPTASAAHDDGDADHPGGAIPPIQSLLATHPDCRVASVFPVAGSGVRGKSALCASSGGIRLAMEVDHLRVGDAYADWLAYFDRATACQSVVCTLDDALGGDPASVFVRVDGSVVQTRSTHFTGDLRDLRLSLGSQVSLTLVAHGPASASAIDHERVSS